MRKLAGLIFLFFSLTGCKTVSYVQLYETAATNSKLVGNVYTYENDTLRIDYVLWDNNGLMTFRISNKSSKPIYIDWFKSSYISNSSRNQYWTDQSKTSVSFDAISYRYGGYFTTIAGFTGGAVASHSKPEKISFIPPKSYIYQVGYALKTNYFSDWGKDYTRKTEPRIDRPKLNTIISTKTFSQENSPLNFRNFLTFSFKEDFSSEFYVDNEFYVKSVSVMEKLHFWNPGPDKDGNYFTQTRFKSGTSFYIQH